MKNAKSFTSYAGPAVVLTVLGFFGLYRVLGKQEPRPPEQFLDAELLVPAEQSSPSCYSLHFVLTANFALRKTAAIHWRHLDEQIWSLEVVRVDDHGQKEPPRTYTFKVENGQARLIDYQPLAVPPQTLQQVTNALLEAPRQYRSTQVVRCQADRMHPTPSP